MQIYIGHMDKRINSTKKTHTGEWTTKGPIEVTLKEPTTIDKPLFLLRRKVYDTDGTTLLYELQPSDNWIYVPYWGYYWIDQTIMSTNDLVTFACHRDVLASGHDYLMSCEAYLSYCSDKKIAADYQTMDDPRFGPDKFVAQVVDNLKDTWHEGQSDESYTLIKDWFVDDPLSGSVLVSLTGVNAGSLLYFMTPEQYVQLVHYVASGANVSDVNVLAAAFLGTDWKACLNYAIYVPIKLDKLQETYTNTISPVLWGNVPVSIGQVHYTASPFQCLVHTSNRGITFTGLAENDDYAFLKGPKYSTVILETPSSSQDISSEAFTVNDYLYIKESMNLINGDYTMKVYASNYSVQGVPLAAVTEHLGVDITGISKSMQSSKELAAQIIKKATTAAVVAGGAMIAAGAAHESAIAAAKSHNAGIASQASKYGLSAESYAKAEGISMAARPSASSFIGGAGAGYATGILGNFSGGGCSPVGAAYSCGGGLTAYFCCEADTDHTPNARKNFRIITTTAAPAIIADEAGTFEAMGKFAKLHGYPCNKWAALKKIAANSYIEGVKLSVVSTSDDQYEPSMPEFTLTPAEIGELNNFVNTGIYLEDWETEPDPEE